MNDTLIHVIIVQIEVPGYGFRATKKGRELGFTDDVELYSHLKERGEFYETEVVD